ncbi:hypothetical protein [Chromobacterium vaccinii]|nr:hypothetical protein [Chromobacterium vaccinii]
MTNCRRAGADAQAGAADVERPEGLAKAAVFLAFEESSYMLGG